MLTSTEGIVLSVIKYGETSVIATIFTKESGRQSYIINSVRSRRAKNRLILQPLFLVDVEAYHKETRDIQRVKEIKNFPVYQNIPFDVRKSAQVFFLAEILNKTLREQESYPEMFSFLKNSLLFFDLDESPAVNFHLYLLFHLTEYLGFLPDMRFTASEGWFDLHKGVVVDCEPSHMFYANRDATVALCRLSTLKIGELSRFTISHSMRGYLTSKLVEYYKLHFEHLGEIKSLKVLQELFS